jgi:3'-phosphoadenosine 5'-phosphosulfate sulfotransferase (PAPS reductase)/FAD synthetase
MIDIWQSEGIVEEMQNKAERVVVDVQREFRISHVIAAFSGGDDSIVSTHWAMERFDDACLMIGDTQIGLQATRDHQTRCVNEFGWDVERVSPVPEGPPKGWAEEWIDGDTSFEEFVLNHGFPGHAQHGRMYQRLKQRAFRKIKKRIGHRPKGSRIMVVSGIRSDESAIRAGYKRAFNEEPKEGFVWVNPFYHCTAADFEMYRQEFGLPRNPVKALVGISGECCCGAHATEGEREAYRVAEPGFADYLDELESRVMERFPWGWQNGPPRWWKDKKRGQGFLLPPEEVFMPACVGCLRKGQA